MAPKMVFLVVLLSEEVQGCSVVRIARISLMVCSDRVPVSAVRGNWRGSSFI